MASTCVPGFTPITIDKKHLIEEYGNCPNKPELPKLIDALTNLTGLSKKTNRKLGKTFFLADGDSNPPLYADANNGEKLSFKQTPLASLIGCKGRFGICKGRNALRCSAIVNSNRCLC